MILVIMGGYGQTLTTVVAAAGADVLSRADVLSSHQASAAVLPCFTESSALRRSDAALAPGRIFC